LLVDLVERLRAVLRPETVLSIRFAAQDRLDGGLTFEDTLPLARRLGEAGMDVFNVSSGLGGWRRGREQRGEGYLVADAAAVRKAVDRPVIGVGGIETLGYCAEALSAGHVDMLAVGRAILENPAWPQPVAACA
jgi:NADPH2 dehydrogenase